MVLFQKQRNSPRKSARVLRLPEMMKPGLLQVLVFVTLEVALLEWPQPLCWHDLQRLEKLDCCISPQM